MLRRFRRTGEKGNRSHAPSGRSWRNLCANEESKDSRIARHGPATHLALCDLPESGGCNGAYDAVLIRISMCLRARGDAAGWVQ